MLLLSVRQLSIHVGFVCCFGFFSFQILWTFSIYLESVAILPQLFMISKTGEAETITTHYLFFLGLYRALYLVNWIWRYYFEGFFDLIAVVAGVVQTVLYCDFFYLYVTKGKWYKTFSFRLWNVAINMFIGICYIEIAMLLILCANYH